MYLGLLILDWGIVHLMQLGFGLVAVWRICSSHSNWNALALTISAMASVLPMLTFVLYAGTCVFGRSSAVQFPTLRLWDLTIEAWPILYHLNPVAFVVSLVSVFLMPLPSRGTASLVARIAGVVASGLAFYAVVVYFPTV